jgi:hypothetical protein
MALTPFNSQQLPDKSILDAFGRQIYLGNQFIASSTNVIVGSTAEIPFVLLSNPLTGIEGTKALFHDSRKLTCLTADQSAIFRFYFNPVVSVAGTPFTPVNLRPAIGSTASISVVQTLPTTTSFGQFIALLASNSLTPDVSTLLSILDAGQSLLITVQGSSADTQVSYEISWYEL